MSNGRKEGRETAGTIPRSGPRQKRAKLLLVVMLGLAGGTTAFAEVLSVTLGIDVNSPYGISEPWVTIRNGLLRLDYVESVGALADRKTATGELRTKGGRLPQVEALALALRETGAGATLRGIEVTVRGQVVRRGEQFFFESSQTGEEVALASITQRVQLNTPPLSEQEKNAFADLTAHWKGAPLEARITGPLRSQVAVATNSPQRLEVRVFDLTGSAQNQTKN